MIITDIDDRRKAIKTFENERDGAMGTSDFGHPDRDIFDIVCNDILRLELHVEQARLRLDMMAGTRADVASNRANRMLIKSMLSHLDALREMSSHYSRCMSVGRKGLEQTFGHLGDREHLS